MTIDTPVAHRPEALRKSSDEIVAAMAFKILTESIRGRDITRVDEEYYSIEMPPDECPEGGRAGNWRRATQLPNCLTPAEFSRLVRLIGEPISTLEWSLAWQVTGGGRGFYPKSPTVAGSGRVEVTNS
ncbi:MAG: hypothetical protein ACU84Q_17960 [Gammaproteobacteria bacterium]